MEEIKNIQWPGWETVRLIGRGSYGAVYEIERDLFGKKEKAALKHIGIPQNPSDIEEMYSDGYDDESITASFQSHLESIVAEYSLMRKLNGAANVVNCDDVKYVQREDGIGWDIFIKMELLTPLTKALQDPISEETVIKIAADMCHALSLCKRFDIVHRDIKPQNIFVSPLGDYKLGDFGIAKTVEKTMGGTKTGTYKYMAPEVYNNMPYGQQADIYSLGLVLYWLLNKRRMPFLPLPPQKLTAGMDEQARNRRLSGEPLPTPVDGSEDLKRIVLKACAYNPRDRFHTADEMLQALGRLRNDPRPTSAAPPNKETFVPEDGEVGESDNELTFGLIGSRKPSMEDATLGAFGAGVASVARQDIRKDNQPIVLQGDNYKQVQPTQQDNKNRSASELPLPQEYVRNEKQKKKYRCGVWIAIAASLVVVISVILLMLYGKGNNTSKNSTDVSALNNNTTISESYQHSDTSGSEIAVGSEALVTDSVITEATEPEPIDDFIVDQIDSDSSPVMSSFSAFYHDGTLYYVINYPPENNESDYYSTLYSCESLDAPAKALFSGSWIENVSAVGERLFFSWQPDSNGSYVVASIKTDGSDYQELTERTENITLPHYSYGWIYAFDYNLYCTVRFRTDGSDRQVIHNVHRAEAFANGCLYYTKESAVMRYDPELQSSQEVAYLDGVTSITICSVYQNKMILHGYNNRGWQSFVVVDNNVVDTRSNCRGCFVNGSPFIFDSHTLYQLNPNSFDTTATVALPVPVPSALNDYVRVVPLADCIVISSESENGLEGQKLYVVSTDGTLLKTLNGQ